MQSPALTATLSEGEIREMSAEQETRLVLYEPNAVNPPESQKQMEDQDPTTGTSHELKTTPPSTPTRPTVVMYGANGPTELEVFSYSEVVAGKAKPDPKGRYSVSDALKIFTNSKTPPRKPLAPSGDLAHDSLLPGDEEHRPSMSWHLLNNPPSEDFIIEEGSTRVIPASEEPPSPGSPRPESPSPIQRNLPIVRRAFKIPASNPTASTSSQGDAEIGTPSLDDVFSTPSFQPLSAIADRPEFTPKPPNGFPRIHGDRPFFLFANQPAAQRQAWSNMPGPKLGIQVYDEDASNPTNAIRLAGTLAATIEHLFNIQNVAIATPQIATLPTLPHSPPFTFLAHNFSQDVASAMLQQGTYSSKAITFHVFKICWTLPRFICGFTGFTSNDELAIKVAFRDILQEANAIDFVTDLTSDNPHYRNLPPGKAFYRILNSLEVQILDNRLPGGVRAPIVNIYIDSPTVDPAKWMLWRNFIFSLKISTDFLGTAVGLPNRPCSGCHSADHPRGLCPFPSIPGWNGPSSTSYNANRPATPHIEGRSNNRGMPGRTRLGRGRGTTY